MSQTLDFEHKRKRSAIDNGAQHSYPYPQQNPLQQGRGGYINFMLRPNSERLALIQGDSDTFADVLNLLADYENALERQESLAANLGAKLTGPRIVKGIDRFFDAPIKTNSTQPFANPVNWIDVVLHAKAHPSDFLLTTLPDGARCCQFQYKGLQCEVSEDDWRLISSGALDRFPLEHPFEEDETAELATLDILESRASVLYKKADEVAARARILHHRIGVRKQDLTRRRNAENSQRYQSTGGIPPARLSASGAAYDLHADLLQQFRCASSTPATAPPSRPQSVAALSPVRMQPLSPSGASPRPAQHRISVASGRSRSSSHVADAPAAAETDHRTEFIRSLATQKAEKLQRGDIINPPCDRCRRLRQDCLKYLSACQGCTKKHAKCTWRKVTEEEAANLKTETDIRAEHEAKLLSEGISPPDDLDGITIRPGSCADADVTQSAPSTRYSPGPMSSAHSDPSSEPPRTSLPTLLPSPHGPPPLGRGGDLSGYMRPPFLIQLAQPPPPQPPPSH